MKRTAIALGATVLLNLTAVEASQPPTVHRPAAVQQPDPTLLASDLPDRLSPPSHEPSAYGLTLERTVQLALERNMDLLIAAYGPAIADANLMMEQGAFDPVVSASMAAAGYENTAQGNQVLNNSQMSIAHRAGNGTVYSVQYRNNLNNGLNQNFQPFFGGQPSTVVSIDHPLMRGSGANVVRAGVNIAKHQREAALLAYQQKALEVAAAAEQSYWNLAISRRRLELERVALEHTRGLEKIVTDNIRLGRLAEYEAYQTRQRMASQQVSVRGVERDARQAEQTMQRILRVAIAGTTLRPEEHLVYDKDRVTLVSSEQLPAMIDDAVKRRPEVRMMEIQVANLQIQEKVAQNATLPMLNLVGEYRIGGTSTGAVVDGFGNRVNSNLYKYRVGIEFGMPIGNHEAMGRLKKAKMELAQGRVMLENVKQAVALEVSQALATMEAAGHNVESARESTRAAEQHLAAEQERFTAGLTTVGVVLEAQKLVQGAHGNELAALAEYYTAQVAVHRATGQTLSRYSIALSPPEPGKEPSTDLALPPDT